MVVAYMNGCFHREALEKPSIAIWVSEVMELTSVDAANRAAKTIARNADKFPTLHEFRIAYRQALDKLNVGKELNAAEPEVAPPPPEAVEMLARMEAGSVLRSID